MKLFEALKEEGTSHYLVLCYGVYDVKNFEQTFKQFEDQHPNTKQYSLYDEQWACPILLSEQRVECSEGVAIAAMELLSRNLENESCRGAKCMFDGAFYSYDDMFSEATADQVYAFCMNRNEIVLAMDDVMRGSKEWKSIVASQRQHIA